MTKGSGPDAEPRALAAGEATAVVLVLDEPLSLWGGIDAETGLIVDRRHPQAGESLTGKILVMTSGRGSSSSSSVLAEAVRARTAPVGIVLREPDPILAIGSVVAADLYGTRTPVVIAPGPLYRSLRTGDSISLDAPAAGRPARLDRRPA